MIEGGDVSILISPCTNTGFGAVSKALYQNIISQFGLYYSAIGC